MTLLEYGVVSAHAEAFSSPHKREESRLCLVADGRPCVFPAQVPKHRAAS
jgi:hypothetical protein